MQNDIKLSLIVPVYKVEKYLRRSMDSLTHQTLNGLEIICINDGSPDNCLQILKEYQDNTKNVKITIIDKKNEGVWKGRFDGINSAKGEYIGFVDSDDYIALNYAEKLYLSAKESGADISVCGFYRVDVDTDQILSTEMTQYTGKCIDMRKEPEEILSINTSLWNKIYKSYLLKGMKNLEFPPRILDDMMFLMLIYLNANTIKFISDPLYYYMIRQDSIMGQIRKEQIESTEKAMIEIRNLYNVSKRGLQLLPVVDAMAFLHLGVSLMYRISEDETSNLRKELSDNRRYLNKNFPLWKHSKYLSLHYTIAHSKSNIKLAIVKKFYVLNCYPLFLWMYKSLQKGLKKDIKW